MNTTYLKDNGGVAALVLILIMAFLMMTTHTQNSSLDETLEEARQYGLSSS